MRVACIFNSQLIIYIYNIYIYGPRALGIVIVSRLHLKTWQIRKAPNSNPETQKQWYIRGHFKTTYELLNIRALKISMLYKGRIFQCMGKIFCMEFQKYPLKFHTKYLTHTLKDVDFIHRWKLKSSSIKELISVFETPPRFTIPSNLILHMLNRFKNHKRCIRISYRIFSNRRPNSQRSNPTCCLSYTVNTMPADALAT